MPRNGPKPTRDTEKAATSLMPNPPIPALGSRASGNRKPPADYPHGRLCYRGSRARPQLGDVAILESPRPQRKPRTSRGENFALHDMGSGCQKLIDCMTDPVRAVAGAVGSRVAKLPRNCGRLRWFLGHAILTPCSFLRVSDTRGQQVSANAAPPFLFPNGLLAGRFGMFSDSRGDFDSWRGLLAGASGGRC